jgi:hypothetical protein
VTLEHGLTFDRVNSIEANGPDENFVEPGGKVGGAEKGVSRER